MFGIEQKVTTLPVKYMEADNRFEWLPTNIKNPPTLGSLVGVDPKVVAIECTTGCTMPPPRAVLLGTKGARRSSMVMVMKNRGDDD